MKQIYMLRNEAIRNNAIDAILSLPIDDKSPHEVHVRDPNRSYEQESVERALTCANCGQKLHVLEVHVCEHCCAELMSDPNSSMHEEEDDG